MLDQLTIGAKKSLDDFDTSLKERRINAPEKKSIKETVPYSNKTYDFSAINGEIYWNERALEYVFEIVADTPVQLEQKKNAFSAWVMNTMQQPIFDPFEPGWYYLGTFDSIDYDDDESVEKTTITVVFSAYPYKIKTAVTEYSTNVPAVSEFEWDIFNASVHCITPTIIAGASLTIQMGNVSYSIPAGEVTDDSFKLAAGNNILKIINANDDDCILTIQFTEEVF